MKSESPSSAGQLVIRVFTGLFGERSQRIWVHVLAIVLVILGLTLAFSDAALSILSRFTERPELLPVTLLVPYMWMIFQMLLHRIERDESDELLQLAYEVRLTQIEPRRHERTIVVDAFERSLHGCKALGTERSKVALADWIVERRTSPTIQVQMLAYSSETFLDPVVEAARLIAVHVSDGGQCPEVVRLQLLVRDLGSAWSVPLVRQFDADQRYVANLKARFRQYLARWRPEIEDAYGEFMLAKNISLEFKTYTGEPLLKGAMVNGEIGLVGMYGFGRIDEEGVGGWDYHGHGAGLHMVSATDSATQQEREAFELLRATFDSIWQRGSSLAVH